MTRLLSLLCAVAISSTTLHARQSVPRLEAVHGVFYTKYNLSALEIPYITFEKRDKEWYVVTYVSQQGVLKRKVAYQFYAGDEYRELPDNFSHNETPVAAEDVPAIDPHDISNYGLQTYYGYPGWYKDVVTFYAGRPPVTDSNYYGLARAYSTMANALLSDQYGDALPGEGFHPPMKNDCLSAGQIRRYDSVCRLAVNAFKKVQDINPSYQTIVGPISMKCANEQVVPFHGLLTYAGSSAAGYQLPDHLYSDSVLEHNRMVLNSCPKDAVLLSMGDNDFYPVLYLQQKEQLRRDVYLINFSLLGMDRYLFRYQYPQFEAKGIDLKLDSLYYYGQRNDYIRIGYQEHAKDMHLKDLENVLKENDPEKKIIDKGTFIVREAEQNRKAVKMKLDIGNMYKYNWSILVMLHHLGNRKFCTQYPFYDILSPLNTYLKQKGPVWVLE